MAASYAELPNRLVSGANGVDYAYRDTGPDAVGTPQTSPGEYLGVFFTASPASRQAGQQAMQRMYARTQDRDTATNWATRQAQYDAVCAWGIPDHTRVTIYPDAAHGFLFQHHADFAADVETFLR